jgi:hypothetical protein
MVVVFIGEYEITERGVHVNGIWLCMLRQDDLPLICVARMLVTANRLISGGILRRVVPGGWRRLEVG